MNEQNTSKMGKASIRFNEQEKDHLMKLAKENGLSFSEYIRERLFEDRHLNKTSAYQKDIATFTALSYYLLGKLAKERLTEEEIKECSKRAELFLKEHNMMPE